MKIVVIGDRYTVSGLRLAGVGEGYTVDTSKEAIAIVSQIMKREDVSLVFLDRQFSEHVREILPVAYERSKPLIVDIPTMEEGGRDYTHELLRRTIGVDLGGRG